MSKSDSPEKVMETETIHMRKYFGHTFVNWKIENFCLTTCEDNFLIHSQDIYIRGDTITKWKMILNPKTTDRRISLCLQRLELKPSPQNVTVNWRFNLVHTKTLDRYITKEGYAHFQTYSTCVVDMYETLNVYKKILPFDSDELYIHCQIIVINENNVLKFPTAPSYGIKSLSEDLWHLYTAGCLYDIILKSGDKFITAHKVILHFRNEKFAKLLKTEHEKRVIDLSQFTFETVEKLVNYIYTGDIQPFLEKPSIDLYECAIYFSIYDVLFYYFADELIFHTTVDVQSISYLWTIPNFSSPNDYVSPILAEESNTIWQIQVSSNTGLNGVEYVNFAAEIIDGVTPQGICVEFGVVDADQNMLSLNRILKNIAENELIGRKFVVQRLRDEIDPYVENGTLHVVARIRMAPGTYTQSSGKSIMQFSTESKGDNPYSFMSTNLINMLESGAFCDITLKTKGGTIRSHKCILSARSSFFSEEIRKRTIDVNEINVNMAIGTMKQMLFYIYSGRVMLSNYEDWTSYQMMSIAASYLGVPSCKVTISLTFYQIMSVSSVITILIYANKVKDMELENSAINFISKNLTEVSQQDKWIKFTQSYPLLMKKVTSGCEIINK